MTITTEKQQDGRTHKIISKANPEDKRHIGYNYKPLYKFLGLCPHRFVRGTGLLIENRNETPSIIYMKRGSVKVYGVQKHFEISKGFEITLDDGIRAAMQLAKVLYVK